MAIVEALRYCISNHYTHIWLQTDSLLLKNILTGIWKPPWIIAEHVEEILVLLGLCNKKVTHIYREGNKLADHLANYALDSGNIKCYGYWQLDTRGRRIVNDDSLQCPYLRPEGKGCEELVGEVERGIMKEKVTGGNIIHHQSQILREVGLVIFLPNHAICFAGQLTVTMPYILFRPHWVVLALSTHSLEEETKKSTSIYGKDELGQSERQMLILVMLSSPIHTT